MPHMEDDDPPIRSHPASKEYRANFDRIFGEPPPFGAGTAATVRALATAIGVALDEPRVEPAGNTMIDNTPVGTFSVEKVDSCDRCGVRRPARTRVNGLPMFCFDCIPGTAR